MDLLDVDREGPRHKQACRVVDDHHRVIGHRDADVVADEAGLLEYQRVDRDLVDLMVQEAFSAAQDAKKPGNRRHNSIPAMFAPPG